MTWQINLEQTRSGLLIQSLLVIVIRNNSNTGIETSLNFLPSSETFTGNVFSYVCVCVCVGSGTMPEIYWPAPILDTSAKNVHDLMIRSS